jgi:hypothetical protein
MMRAFGVGFGSFLSPNMSEYRVQRQEPRRLLLSSLSYRNGRRLEEGATTARDSVVQRLPEEEIEM